MNAYFFKMTNEERNNILDQHKEVYDGFVTSYVQPEKNQPLYVQDLANDKQGLTVSNKGVVTGYKNMNINEMKHDGKSTGLFSDEEPKEQGHVSPGAIYDTEETFESEEDEGYFVSLGEQLDMIGDGEDDLEHGVFDDEDENFLEDYEDGWEGNPYEYMKNAGFDDDLEDGDLVFDFDSKIMKDIDDEDVDGLFDSLNESLDMFRRFKNYN